MSVLVTGGAGYIGAHVVRLLQERGADVVVVDSDSARMRERLSHVVGEAFDLAGDSAHERLRAIMTAHSVDSVIHLAALKQVGESVARPAAYFRQNIGGLANVVEAAQLAGVNRFVFSSSAAVYGTVDGALVDETMSTRPINPYGETKLAGEWMLRDAATAFGLRAVSLRYFNVAGAGWPELGDPTVQNLVTIAIQRVLNGEAPIVYGDDFETVDGSGVRDYVHVLDLARAHIDALDYLEGEDRPFDVFNVGTGAGSSVFEVVDQIARASGEQISADVWPKRAGDPAQVVADTTRISSALGWSHEFELPEIVESAWRAAQWQAGTH